MQGGRVGGQSRVRMLRYHGAARADASPAYPGDEIEAVDRWAAALVAAGVAEYVQ